MLARIAESPQRPTEEESARELDADVSLLNVELELAQEDLLCVRSRL